MPEHLEPLTEDHVQQMYENAQSHEPVFRNILVNLADDDEETDFFKHASIDDIFRRYVRIEGLVTRVSDFQVGPYNGEYYELGDDEAMISIRTPGPSWEKLYAINPDNSVRFVKNFSTSMH